MGICGLEQVGRPARSSMTQTKRWDRIECVALRERRRLTCRRRCELRRTGLPGSHGRHRRLLRRCADHAARIVPSHLQHSRTGHWRVCRRFGLLGGLRGLRPGDRLRHDDPRPTAGNLFRHRRGERTLGRFGCRGAGAGDALPDHCRVCLPARRRRNDRGGGVGSAAVGGGGDRLGLACRGTRHRNRLGSDDRCRSRISRRARDGHRRRNARADHRQPARRADGEVPDRAPRPRALTRKFRRAGNCRRRQMRRR